MDAYRFYVPGLAERLRAEGEVVTLPEGEAHHARGVLRLQGGEAVVLFDGAGAWMRGAIAPGGVEKRAVRVVVNGELRRDLPAAMRVTLATAVPKGERAEWLVEQASQLNVARVQWLSCDRGVVKPREGGGKMEKWRRMAVESAKQCHRTHLLEIAEPAALAEVLANAGEGAMIMWLDPGAAATFGGLAEARSGGACGAVVALIGPEGGWSEREMALLASHPGVMGVRMTPTVLRIETACTAIAALLLAQGR